MITYMSSYTFFNPDSPKLLEGPSVAICKSRSICISAFSASLLVGSRDIGLRSPEGMANDGQQWLSSLWFVFLFEHVVLLYLSKFNGAGKSSVGFLDVPIRAWEKEENSDAKLECLSNCKGQCERVVWNAFEPEFWLTRTEQCLIFLPPANCHRKRFRAVQGFASVQTTSRT